MPKAKDYSIWGMKDTKNRENPLFFLGGGGFLPNQTIEWLIAQSGLYSFIIHKSAAADKKRTLVERYNPGVKNGQYGQKRN